MFRGVPEFLVWQIQPYIILEGFTGYIAAHNQREIKMPSQSQFKVYLYSTFEQPQLTKRLGNN